MMRQHGEIRLVEPQLRAHKIPQVGKIDFGHKAL